MKNRTWLTVVFIPFTISLGMVMPSKATDIHLSVTASDGSGELTVMPGEEIAFQIRAELTDQASQGLASLVFDLEWQDAVLTEPLDEPDAGPMLQFIAPLGFAHNAAGFGGTLDQGRILQAGGTQNVFSHGSWDCDDDDACPLSSVCASAMCTPLAGLPTGTLQTHIAQAGNPVVVASGRVIVPLSGGVFPLRVTNVQAAVVAPDTTGQPFWATADAPLAQADDLIITVQPPITIPSLSGAWVWLFCALMALAAVMVLRASRNR